MVPCIFKLVAVTECADNYTHPAPTVAMMAGLERSSLVSLQCCKLQAYMFDEKDLQHN